MRNEESRIQKACVKWFRLQYPRYARLLFAVPNGGARSAVTGSILKTEGVVAGVSDLILLIPSGRYHALCIEMKATNGRQQDSQKIWEKEVSKRGYKYVVCRSVEEFIEVINSYIEVKQIN